MSTKSTAKRNSKEWREEYGRLSRYCRQHGMTAGSVGRSIDALIEEALAQDDPEGYLGMYETRSAETAVSGDAAGDTAATGDGRGEENSRGGAEIAEEGARTEKKEDKLPTINIEIPYVKTIPEGVYVPATLSLTEVRFEVRLDGRLRRMSSSRAFKRVANALLQDGRRLSSGRRVETAANVVEWLAERMAEAMGEEP